MNTIQNFENTIQSSRDNHFSKHSFEDYIQYLRENFTNLVEYRERTGTLEPGVRKIKEALFNEDPFIVFSASLAATIVMADKSIYH